MSSFALYLIGFGILLAGLVFGAFQVGVPPTWIGIGALIVIGIGVMAAVNKTRRPDSSQA
ncbi:MAG: hypothetical protein AAF752_07245 [Bacteroidota bacterium]